MNCLAFSSYFWPDTIDDTMARSFIFGPATTGITSNLPYRDHDFRD